MRGEGAAWRPAPPGTGKTQCQLGLTAGPLPGALIIYRITAFLLLSSLLRPGLEASYGVCSEPI